MVKTEFSGRQIASEKAGALILCNTTKRNTASLLVDSSSSQQSKNRHKIFEVLSITPGEVGDIKGEPGKNYYNYNNSNLNVNGEEIIVHSKAKYFKGWFEFVYVCNLSVYGGVLSTDTIKNIRLYPMKKDMFDTWVG